MGKEGGGNLRAMQKEHFLYSQGGLLRLLFESRILGL
jgi:hypothetical protein